MNIFAIICGIVLVILGIIHLAGVLATWDSRGIGFNEKPWIFSKDVNLHDPIGRLFGLPWLVASLSLVAAGFDPLYRFGLWPILPLVGAGCSLVAIIPWWRAVPWTARVSAVFDVAIIVLLVSPLRDRILSLLFA